MLKSIQYFIFIVLLAIISCKAPQKNSYQLTKNYNPDNLKLFKEIVQLDSLFFDAYNNCSTMLEKYGTFYSDNIEFYHDEGGFMTSKKDIINATQKNICGKVTRELINGSIEVYPIKGHGAIEFGLHRFHNNQEPPGSPSRVGRFTIIWHKENDQWRISRVVSLH